MTAANLSLDELAQHCAEETQKFTHSLSNDPQYCFELLSRALLDGLSDAFTHIYRIYEKQVVSWVYNHSRFIETGEEANYFASAALSNFYFALRGRKFAQFTSLPQALAYLKLCVHTSIAQYIRDQRPTITTPLEDSPELAYSPDPAASISASELWEHICLLLPDERDRVLAHCVFVQHLKPTQIVTAYPAEWKLEREVSVALQRIRRILRKDGELRQWADVYDEHAEHND
jgi:hypothetical protein